MAAPSEKLASSLEALKKLQDRGIVAIQTNDLSRIHRQRLVQSGFLQEVIKGWYIPSRPGEQKGESTAWYTSFWNFCASYLNQRFGNDWCLSPDQSLSLHAGNWTIPVQLLVRTPRGNNKATTLPHHTSLFDARYKTPNTKDIVVKNGLRLFSLASALVTCSPKFFTHNTVDAKAALALLPDASDVLGLLLEGGHSKVASRMAGAFRNIGRHRIADEIIQTMRTAGYDIREDDPFETKSSILLSNYRQSPYVNRLHLLWQKMREAIINDFPKSPGLPKNINSYLKQVDEIYATDAYNSLSIEGYRVSPELIEQVKKGKWNPDNDENDRDHRNALAARGYWQAFQAVKDSVRKVLKKENPGKVAEADHRMWYREMFSPSIIAGILQPMDLAGYRNHPVYIRHSMYVPPSCEAVRDLMPAFFELLEHETESAVRIVLGHFFFVYIHPYMDGNGRLGRFLMNVMCASGGYAWVIVPLEKRKSYMAALEEASVRQNIAPFRDFLAQLIRGI